LVSRRSADSPRYPSPCPATAAPSFCWSRIPGATEPLVLLRPRSGGARQPRTRARRRVLRGRNDPASGRLSQSQRPRPDGHETQLLECSSSARSMSRYSTSNDGSSTLGHHLGVSPEQVVQLASGPFDDGGDQRGACCAGSPDGAPGDAPRGRTTIGAGAVTISCPDTLPSRTARSGP
jgi:hypothetical protein